MFGFGEHQEAMQATCPCCQTQMQDMGTLATAWLPGEKAPCID